MTTLAVLSLLIWLYLLLAHGRFWHSEPELPPSRPTTTPTIAIVVPARDEAHSISEALRSLLAQNYVGDSARSWSMMAVPMAPAASRAPSMIRA